MFRKIIPIVALSIATSCFASPDQYVKYKPKKKVVEAAFFGGKTVAFAAAGASASYAVNQYLGKLSRAKKAAEIARLALEVKRRDKARAVARVANIKRAAKLAWKYNPANFVRRNAVKLIRGKRQ